MAELPLPQAVDRFKANEDRIDTFVNDPLAAGTYTTSEGQPVKTLPVLAAESQALASDLASTTDPAKGAALVGYLPANTGATGTTVQDKLREVVSLQDFWRSGDGTDYSSAMQRALDSGEPVITGNGRQYTVAGSLTGRGDLILRDIILDAPGLSSNGYIIDFSGVDGVAQTLASDYAEGAFGMTVPNGAAFTVGGWAWLQSNEYWAAVTGDNVKYGEYVQIIAIAGNDLVFGPSTLLKYQVAAGATIRPVSLIDRVSLHNVGLKGPVSTGNQGGLRFRRCGNVLLDNVKSEDFDYTHILFERSVRGTVRGGSSARTGAAEGLDYGVVASNGCFDLLVDGYRGNAMRHIVSIGGSQGVSRHISAVNCRGYDLTDAGLDSHSSVYEHTFANNFLHFSDDVDMTMDGIAVQGAMPTVTGNKIYNCKRHGIVWQPEAMSAFSGPISGEFTDNTAICPRNTGSNSGFTLITPSTAGVAPVTSVTVKNMNAYGFGTTITFQANAGEIRKATIDNPVALNGARVRGINVVASGAEVNGLTIIGGHLETDNLSTSGAIALTGVGVNYVRNWKIIGTHIKRGAGAIGIALTQTADGFESGVTTEGVTVKYSIDAASSNYSLDRSKSTFPIVTNSTYTVNAQDEHLVCNRAGTITVTLPDAALHRGRKLHFKTIQAQAVDSASANVAPIGDSAAGTAILPATDGAWALLVSNGTNWIVMQRGT